MDQDMREFLRRIADSTEPYWPSSWERDQYLPDDAESDGLAIPTDEGWKLTDQGRKLLGI